jgi:hypothetical protein
MRAKFLLGAAVVTLSVAGSAAAHHSGAMFDASKKTTIAGVISEFQWTNPHAWVELQAIDPTTRKPEKYIFEGLGVNQLSRAGWNKASMKPGDEAVIVYNPLRNGELGGRLVTVSINGKQLPTRGE